MIEDADGAGVAAGDEGLHHGGFVIALAEGEDFEFFSNFHAVEVEAMKVGLHEGEVLPPGVDGRMTVMPVVDDANVVVSEFVELFANRDEVGGLAAPSAVVVEGELAVDGGGAFGEWFEVLGSCGDFFFLGVFFWGRKHLPDLRLDLVLFEEAEGFGVLSPEGEEFNSVFFVGEDFFFEGRNVFLTPIVGAAGETKFLQHDSPLFGSPFGGVERDDAPGDEFVFLKVGGEFLSGEACEGEESEESKNHGRKKRAASRGCPLGKVRTSSLFIERSLWPF